MRPGRIDLAHIGSLARCCLIEWTSGQSVLIDPLAVVLVSDLDHVLEPGEDAFGDFPL